MTISFSRSTWTETSGFARRLRCQRVSSDRPRRTSGHRPTRPRSGSRAADRRRRRWRASRRGRPPGAASPSPRSASDPRRSGCRSRARWAVRRPARSASSPAGDAPAADGADDPGHELRRPAGRVRRESREARHERQDVLVWQAAEQADEPKDGLIGDTVEEQEDPLELAGLELRNEADGPVEQPDEREEGRQPVPQLRGLCISRIIAAASEASAAVCSRTSTIGSPSRVVR